MPPPVAAVVGVAVGPLPTALPPTATAAAVAEALVRARSSLYSPWYTLL